MPRMGAEMSIEAMKLALDCLEDIFGKDKIDVGAINALRQAIADAEKQEPHCYMDEYGYVEGEMKQYMEENGGWYPVYTTPPQRKPEQESDDLTIAYMTGFHAGKNKDAPQPKPEQEPVAMRYDFDGYGWLYIDNGSGSNWREKIKNAEPLYTAPPQRKWVGLTVGEIEWCFYDANDAQIVAARSIEAKLREKNGG